MCPGFKMHVFIFPLFVAYVFCFDREVYDYVNSDLLVGNVKRRDTIPFHSNNRKWINENSLSYRKTKDIRENEIDRRFEITEALLKEAQRETHLRNNQMNDIRDEEMDSAQLLGDRYRSRMRGRDDNWRIADIRDNELGTNNYNVRNKVRIQRRLIR